MRRRALLASVGVVALGGCASHGTSPTTERRTTDATTESTSTTTSNQRTTTTDDDPGNGTGPMPPQDRASASIVDLQTTDRTYAFSPTGRHTADDGRLQFRFAKTATDDHPAILRAWLTNDNPYENTFDVEHLPVIGRATSRNPRPFRDPYGGGTYRTELVVAPTPENPLAAGTPAVERDEDGLWRVSRLDDWSRETLTLDADETAFGEYYVAGHPDGAGLGRPTGVYEYRGIRHADFQIAVWQTTAPGPSDQSRFAGRSVPALGDAGAAWYHEADGESTAYLQPETERGSLPEQVRFTMVNTGRSALQCGHWNLYKLDDAEWFHVAPYVHTADCRRLAPGQAKTYTLNAYHGEALEAVGYDELGATVGWLGAGTYAVAAGYAVGADRSAALVELTGEERTVVPTEDVTATREDGVVRVDGADPDEDESGDAAVDLVLERTDDAEHRLIPEQVMRDRYRGIRNALAYVEPGVDRVIVETTKRIADRAVDYEDAPARFRFEGDAFVVALATEGSD